MLPGKQVIYLPLLFFVDTIKVTNITVELLGYRQAIAK